MPSQPQGTPRREKRYVDVVSITSAEGIVTPLEIVWDEHTRYAIERVAGCRRAHSLRTGGTGLRYDVRVRGHDTCLYFDTYRRCWFVEAKAR